jgi:hypothetical protein
MKKSILIVLTSILLSFPMNLIGADYDTPHTFSCGDTISADMMNEIFDYIKNVNKMITASELIGTWSCSRYAQSSYCAVNDNITWGWTLETDSGFRYNSGTLVMIDDGDGTYSYTTSKPNIFSCGDFDGAGFGDWVVKNNKLFMNISRGGIKGEANNNAHNIIVSLDVVSNTKFMMEVPDIEAGFTVAECDKQNIPPTTPATFTASASGKTVSLAWTDSSTDETGFKVLRKDSCDGSYSTVGTADADATSTSDTITAAGSYWYRVSATNSNGDSVASKMVKVDVE